ncbi:hypothetical protein ACSTHD_23410, partial [Vibrio parahaemolyticus]
AAISNNALGVAGLASPPAGVTGITSVPAKIIPIKIFDTSVPTTTTMVANAFLNAITLGARVINASFGGPGPLPASVASVLQAAHAMNVLTV